MSSHWSVILLLFGSTSCLASSAVPPQERVVQEQFVEREWSTVAPTELSGVWSSESISGGLAAILHSIHYSFRGDGSYTGAALLGAERPEFEVLSGRWSLDGTTLQLDDAPPAELLAADGRLRLVGPEGTIVFRRANRN